MRMSPKRIEIIAVVLVLAFTILTLGPLSLWLILRTMFSNIKYLDLVGVTAGLLGMKAILSSNRIDK